jgi:hypothetical protein
MPAGPTPIDPAMVASASGAVAPDASNNMGMANPNMQNANPMVPASGPMPQQQMMGQVPNQNPNQGQNQEKQRKKIPIVYIILGIAVLITVGYYGYLFATGGFSDGGSSSGGGGGAATVEDDDSGGGEEDTSNIQDYAGFKFTIPDGYTAEVTDNGLLVVNYDTAYFIALDYTNQYDGYQSYFAGLYPDQASNLANKFSDRDYLIATYQGSDGTYGTRYVSETSDSHLFVGVVLKNAGAASVPNDFSDLTTILDGVEVDSDNTISAGDELDLGRTGAYEAMPIASDVTFNSD